MFWTKCGIAVVCGESVGSCVGWEIAASLFFVGREMWTPISGEERVGFEFGFSKSLRRWEFWGRIGIVLRHVGIDPLRRGEGW